MFWKISSTTSDVDFTRKWISSQIPEFCHLLGNCQGHKFSKKTSHHRHFLVMLNHCKNFREFSWALWSSSSQTLSYRSSRWEVLPENSCTFGKVEIKLFKIVPLKRSLTVMSSLAISPTVVTMKTGKSFFSFHSNHC